MSCDRGAITKKSSSSASSSSSSSSAKSKAHRISNDSGVVDVSESSSSSSSFSSAFTSYVAPVSSKLSLFSPTGRHVSSIRDSMSRVYSGSIFSSAKYNASKSDSSPDKLTYVQRMRLHFEALETDADERSASAIRCSRSCQKNWTPIGQRAEASGEQPLPQRNSNDSAIDESGECCDGDNSNTNGNYKHTPTIFIKFLSRISCLCSGLRNAWNCYRNRTLQYTWLLGVCRGEYPEYGIIIKGYGDRIGSSTVHFRFRTQYLVSKADINKSLNFMV